MALQMSFSIAFAWTFMAAILVSVMAMSTIMKKKNKKKKKKESKGTVPPGDMGLPWLGETMEFCKAQKKNQLFETFVQPRAEKYGEIFKTKLFGSPTVVVNGAEANRFVLSNEFKLFTSAWPSSTVEIMGKDSIMERQGEAHRCIRGIVAQSLSCAGLEAIVPRICETIQSHFDQFWQNRDEIRLHGMAKLLTFTIMFECLLGISVEPEMVALFERALDGIFAPPLKLPGSKFSRAKKARLEIEKLLVGIVRQKKKEMEVEAGEANPGGLLLSRLVASLIRGEISEKEAVDNVVLLVFAAHDTTSFAIAMTFRMLAQNPHCYSLLLQEHNDITSKKKAGENLTMEDTKKMKYTWQVARESMRLLPPIFGSFRKAMADIEYKGFLIPKGWKIMWTTYGTHHNADYFPNPLAFDPTRFEDPIQPYVFMPFGGGPRVCAGIQMAKLNILIFVHFVVTRYNWSLRCPDEPIVVDPVPFPSRGMPMAISPKP
ncbi:taxadiene 5-alpha hydroxylase-like [Diospyros lotus]|uniref:taxadiene 5-alpha hydroxylase-like n=1 Tax=Diospyros lotus TaxID=55363 RepID=UPI00224CE8A4|nr:taxadiene 5-alpha hydroxylase-like [Diospyros lotus]